LAVYGHVILNRKFHFPRVQWNTFHCTLASAIVLYVLFHCTLCVFDKSHPSKCFSYGAWSQFILTQYSKLSKWDLMQIRLVKMAAYSKPFNISLFWYYIKQIMNVFIRAMVRIFSFGERWFVPFNSAVASLNGTFHLSPHENILTIALINIHYLYTVLYCNIHSIFLKYIVLYKSAVLLIIDIVFHSFFVSYPPPPQMS
jgi:hypothetical protein